MIQKILMPMRNALFGLNAMQARFDLVQNRLDALQIVSLGADDRLRKLEELVLGLEAAVSGLGRTLTQRSAQLASVAQDVPDFLPLDPMCGGPDREGLRLAFLVHTLELCNHFGPVWDLLPPGSFSVLLHGPDAAEARAALSRWGCAVRSSQDVLDAGDRYAFLVSNHPVDLGDPPLIKRLATRNVRFMYAAGKSGWNLSAWNALYDVILSFGPHHTQALSALTDATIVQMGYPRFDRFFNETVDRAQLMRKYGCDTTRETVVWLPTWKELSSVGWFDEEVSALMASYNVVVKLHPLMTEQEPERVAHIRTFAFTCLIADSSDNLPLYQLADYMLFDYGGPPMAALYADKKMLLLDVPEAQSDPLLSPDSPDLQIRQVLGSLPHGQGRIAGFLADSDYWQKQEAQRKQLRQPYFAPHYGFSANVAACALMRLESLVANKP